LSLTQPTVTEPDNSTDSVCTSCGACCSFSPDWPRFTIEDDDALDRLPHHFVDHQFFGMRCEEDRCIALTGEVGIATSCSVYADRPEVCRACSIGDDACRMARAKHGLPPIPDSGPQSFQA